jgi:6-pyruvoyltetrahydropterin/6-carboxytetrahydropterin synthase
MYEVTVTTSISASHHLRGYQGKCENVHGHNYKVEATARAERLDTMGLAVDFGILRGHLKQVAEHLDHRDLNQLAEFADCNPSSENLARVIFDQLSARLAGLPVRLIQLRVWETEGNFVTYRPEWAR